MLKLSESFRINERFSVVISHLLVSLMMACFMVTVVQFGQRIDPTWRGEYLPWICLVVSLEGLYARRATRRLRAPEAQWLFYRGAEVVIILIGLKIYLYFLIGFGQVKIDLGLWQKDFVHTFFSGEYLIGVCLVLFVWLISGQYAEDLVGLEGDEIFLGNEIPPGMANERIVVRDRLMEITFVFGFLMVFLAGFVRLDWRAAWGERPPLQVGAWNVLLYFILAFALLSQTQFAILRVRWALERITPNRNLAVRWMVYGILFALTLAGITIVLPVRYSLGLLTILAYVFDLLVSAMMAVWGLFLFLFASLLALIGKSGINPDIPKVVLPKIPDLPQSSIEITPQIPWLELLKSTFFWIVFIGVIGFSVYQYLHQNKELVAKLRQIRGIIWIEKAWGWLRAALHTVNQSVSGVVLTGVQRLRHVLIKRNPEKPWRYLNPRRLPPHQRILFLYLAMVRRATETGLPRDPSQTPYEYEKKLDLALPEVKDELAALTGSFVEIRYSSHPVTVEHASQVQSWWEHIRWELKRIKSP